MDNVNSVDKLHDPLALALVCALTLFPVGFVLLGLGSLMVAEDVEILGEIPGVLYVALVAGLLFVALGMFALTAATPERGRKLGLLALAALITCISTGIAGLHLLAEGCVGSGWPEADCSGD